MKRTHLATSHRVFQQKRIAKVEELARQYALTLNENGEGDHESFERLKKYADEVGVNVTIYNLHLTTAGDSIGDDETLLESVRLTDKWGYAISVKEEENDDCIHGDFSCITNNQHLVISTR